MDSESSTCFNTLVDICVDSIWVRVAILLATLCLSASAQADSSLTSDVELLRFPYPYQAAVTVCSDLHDASVEHFEAVHTLVNSTSFIRKSSRQWKFLFQGSDVDSNEAWPDGIYGFGLPIADSVMLYASNGVFESFDEKTGHPVPHINSDGRDYRDIIDDWIGRGWVDTLHTAGSGDISRQATEEGLKWLSQAPNRRLTVWVNHSLSNTPSSIEPDVQRALSLVSKNIVKLGTWALARSGATNLAKHIAANPVPRAFPRGQKTILWSLSIALICVISWVALCLVSLRFRNRLNLFAGITVLVCVTSVLFFIPVRYAQGDNPASRYYNVDLVRKAGFRFFWLIDVIPKGLREKRLAVPETSWAGRRSVLSVVRLDDGSDILVFPRSYWGASGSHSLELLTNQALDKLVDNGDVGILYTHWVNQKFSSQALRGLQRLKEQYEAKRVWVTSTSELLNHEYIRTFLQYQARREDGEWTIDIGTVDDPVNGSFTPTANDLRGLSIAIRTHQPIEIHLAGKRLSHDYYDVLQTDQFTVVRFRQPAGSSAAGRSVTQAGTSH